MKKESFYIGDLLVAHDKRGQGIGKIFMKKAEELAKKHNSHKMTLETGKGWRAENFYKSLGFKKEAVLKNHWLQMDFIIYSKNL